MNNNTIDRAYEIICNRPGITRGQLTDELATPGRKGSDRTTARAISHLRDKQRITSEGHGWHASVPTPGSKVLTSACQRAKSSATPGSKGLTAFGTPACQRANSISQAVLIKDNTARMGEEQQESPAVGVDPPERSTIPGIGEQKNLDTMVSNMSAPTIHNDLMQLADDAIEAIDEVRVLLAQSISNIKSSNQSNGYLRGAGRIESMERKPWEHLQYALDLLDSPYVDIYDLLEAITCLQQSKIYYGAMSISWAKVQAKYPAPATRARKPIMHPGPPEDWMDTDPEWEDEVWRAMLADTTAPQSENPGVSPAIPTTEPAIEPIPAAIELPATQEPSIPAPAPATTPPAPEQTARPVRRVRRLQFYDDLAKERAKEEAA